MFIIIVAQVIKRSAVPFFWSSVLLMPGSYAADLYRQSPPPEFFMANSSVPSVRTFLWRPKYENKNVRNDTPCIVRWRLRPEVRYRGPRTIPHVMLGMYNT